MLNKIKSLFKKSNMINEVISSNVDIKGNSELDFWVNVWNKQIIDNVLQKKHININNENFLNYYNQERILEAEKQLAGILWMAKKSKEYLDNKIVVEIGPGCCCALEVSKAKIKIAVEPIAQRYKDNDLLLRNNDSVVYLTCGSENIPVFSNYIDVVIASNCLDHVVNLNESIKEIDRILKPGGELFLNIEINHEPTECEPFALSYDDVVLLFKNFDTVFINKSKGDDKRDWVRAVFKKKTIK